MTSAPSMPSTPSTGRAIQTSLDLHEQINHPLVKVDMAAAFLRRTEQNIVETLIPNGLLTWAFNIARKQKSRREIRILAQSVDDYRNKVLNLRPDWRTIGEDWLKVVAIIIPARSEIRSYELAQWFFCDRSHITHLLKDGTLKTIRAAVGCKSAIIDRQSVVDFLKARRITS